MPPATRRSSGFGAQANSPSNLDHILEHFNQCACRRMVVKCEVGGDNLGVH